MSKTTGTTALGGDFDYIRLANTIFSTLPLLVMPKPIANNKYIFEM